MNTRGWLAALGTAALLGTAGCDTGAGSPNAASGKEGEAMQEEAGSPNQPAVELEADGGQVTGDSTSAGAPTGATGATGGTPPAGGSR